MHYMHNTFSNGNAEEEDGGFWRLVNILYMFFQYVVLNARPSRNETWFYHGFIINRKVLVTGKSQTETCL